MKNLAIALFLALLLSFPALASSNQVVSYHSQVVTAFDPYDHGSQVNVSHHNDVVVNVQVGHGNQVQVFAVSEPQYCSHNQLVAFVNQKNVRVVVQRGILNRFRLAINQTVVNCVQVVKVNGHVVNTKVVRQVRVAGLFGANARRVKQAVAACR
jgi:hypothetical protein